MEKEWFSARELLFHPLLPGTTQAIHKKAKREDWVFRKKIGVQGKGVEYSIHTLPESIRDYIINNSDMLKQTSDQEHLDIWINAFKQLKPHERQRFYEHILRNGILSIYNSL